MYIEVLVEIANKNVDKTFTYSVPSTFTSFIKQGIRVEVPFGKRTLEGFVLNILDSVPEFEVRDILRVIDHDVVLTDELMELGKYLQQITLSSLITCYQAMLPKALKAKQGVQVSKKYEKYLKIVDTTYLAKSPAQEKVLDFVRNQPILKQDAISISASAVKTLLDKGVLQEIQEEVYRMNRSITKGKPHNLTEQQKSAVTKLGNSSYLVSLLHGVTGSGKTEVYMELIERQIANGKQVILLVPEISLTEQITSRFLKRFDRIAVLHSRLSDGEKYDEYRRIARGEVDIVIGARSAVFAPLKDIGMILIDEEQSTSFKQDNNPRYRAIDIAVWRMQRHQGKVILGSATPSLEVYARCLKNVYGLVELTKRVNEHPLPPVQIVDMNDQIKCGNTLFSSYLQEKIQSHLEQNRQIILLLNRRGYASFISCKNCGHVLKCPNCDITLTYHKTNHMLRCHYCGYGEKVLSVCPKCGEKSLGNFGTGTEKVEEKLQELFPKARILRMDLDTTSKKGSHERMIQSFQNHDYDILLGTQIVAKGLDFPLVSLVGVINADTSLNIPDFRSSEDTFQLLSQVAGRSGRSDIPGEVIIQTFNPDHYAIEYAKHHDYLGFFKKEMQFRKTLGYPPYYYLTTLLVSGQNYEEIKTISFQIATFLKKKLTSSIILGPTAPSISKVNNIYRFQIIIKYKKEEQLYSVLTYLDKHYQKNNKVRLDIDFYPTHF